MPRGILRRGSASIAVLAVPCGESSDATDNSLTFVLIWSWRIILPKNACGTVANRLLGLDPKLAVELYEHDAGLNLLEKNRPAAGNLDTWFVPHRESEALLKQAHPTLDAIVAIAPQAVTLHPAAQSLEVWLRYRGLPFARWDDGAFFSESTTQAISTCNFPAEYFAHSRHSRR